MNEVLAFFLAFGAIAGAIALFGALARRAAKPRRANRSAAHDEGVLLI